VQTIVGDTDGALIGLREGTAVVGNWVGSVVTGDLVGCGVGMEVVGRAVAVVGEGVGANVFEQVNAQIRS